MSDGRVVDSGSSSSPGRCMASRKRKLKSSLELSLQMRAMNKDKTITQERQTEEMLQRQEHGGGDGGGTRSCGASRSIVLFKLPL